MKTTMRLPSTRQAKGTESALRTGAIAAVALLFLARTAGVASEIPAKAQDHQIAIVGATIHPVSGPAIEHGTILFDKGKIVAIGANIDVSQTAEKIDATGKQVYPGIIDARSNLGLTEIGAVRATNDITESGSINPNMRTDVAINPESEIIPVTRANGITTAITMPDGGAISGRASAISLDGWTWEDMTLKSPIGLVVNWPSMTINRAWWERRSEDDQKKAREKALSEIRDAFRDARAYAKAKKSESGQNVPYHNTDLRWESMIPVLEGKIPVLMNAEEIQQIEAAVAWADQENVKLVIVGGYDAWRVANLLKAKDIPVIVNPIERTPWRRWEEYDDPATLPKKLLDAGVRFCIAGDGGASNERNVPYNAAMAASYGLPKEEALKAITLYPAQIFGLADRAGSLEVGKDATFIVTNGDPLEIMTNVETEFIQGKNISLHSRHTQFYEKYKEKYKRLAK
jgi:imidazolonepropionase-like amidohydrolase